jgi:hypothetical protein
MPGGGMTPAVPRPTPVTVAFWLVLGGAAVVLLMLVLGFVTDWDSWVEQAREQLAEDGAYTQNDLDSFSRFSAGAVTVGLLVPMGLYILFGALMRSGRNWARVTLTVFLSLGLVAALVVALVPLTLVVRLLAIPLALLCIATIVVMFAGSTGPYFDYRARMRS